MGLLTTPYPSVLPRRGTRFGKRKELVRANPPSPPATETSPLASSSRLLVLLAKRTRLRNPTMALVESDPALPPLTEKKPFEEPPAVLIPPCDPWPRPYYLENGLRRVAPYHFTYNTFCKQRWRGREILDIFASEFRDRPVEYYVCSVDTTKRELC